MESCNTLAAVPCYCFFVEADSYGLLSKPQKLWVSWKRQGRSSMRSVVSS